MHVKKRFYVVKIWWGVKCCNYSEVSGASGTFPVGVVYVIGLCGCVFRAFLCCELPEKATLTLILRVTAQI